MRAARPKPRVHTRTEFARSCKVAPGVCRGAGASGPHPAPVRGILQGRGGRVPAAARTRPEPATFHARGSGRGGRHPREPPARKKEDGLVAVLPRGNYSCWYFGLSPLARARPAGQCLRARETAVTRNASSGGVLVSFANDRFCRLSLLGLCESDPLTLADGAGH